MLTASCHCGNISIVANNKPQTLTSCNCSICNRYGAIWAYFKTADVKIKVKKAQPKAYFWGDEMINFMHCSVCGCVTHYTGRGEGDQEGMDRVAVNTRMSPINEVADIPIRHFDGADTWTFLD